MFFSADKKENLIESGKKLLNSLSIDGIKTLETEKRKSVETKFIYGKSFQNGTPTPDNPIDIQSVVNPKLEICGKNLVNKIIETVEMQGVIVTNNGDGTYTLNGTNTGYWNAYNILQIKFNKNKTIRLTGGNGYAGVILWDTKNNVIKAGSSGSNPNVTVTLEPYVAYNLGILITELTTFDNVVIKPMISTVITDTYDDFEPYKGQTATLPYNLNAIPVSSGGNVTIDGQQYIADYVDIENKKIVKMVDESKFDETVSIIDNTDLLLATPTITNLKDEEVEAFKNMRTYEGVTNIIVSSDDLVPKVEMDMYDYNYDDYVIDLRKHGFYLTANSVQIGVPEPKTTYIEIDGANGVIDVSQALTNDIKYNPRPVSIGFTSREKNWIKNVEIQNLMNSIFNGTKRKLYIDDWYLEGRFINDQSIDDGFGKYTISADCYPYRMNTHIDTKQYTVTSTLNCTIEYTDSMNVCPNINVSDNMSIVIGDNEYNLVSGDNIVPDFILKKGTNTFTLNGSGIVTITWRGGNL